MGTCTSSKNKNSTSDRTVNTKTAQPRLRQHIKSQYQVTIHDIINGYFKKLKSEKVILFDIIPFEIVNICVIYYGQHYSKEIYFKCPGLMDKNIEIARFDMDSAEITYFKHDPSLTGYNNVADGAQMCYIPDVIPDQQLDGILCKKDGFDTPLLILFNPDDKNENCTYCTVECLQNEIKATQFIYIGNRQIVCMVGVDLYRMELSNNLNDIIKKDKFRCWQMNFSGFKRYDTHKICYLQNRQQIFAINNDCFKSWAVFDIWDKVWKNFVCEKYYIYDFMHFKLCYDGCNMVYIVNGNGKIMGYDLDKNVSISYANTRYWSRMESYTVWIERYDKDNIYCMESKQWNDGQIDLKYFNVKDRKWRRRDGYNILTPKMGRYEKPPLVLD